MIYRQGVTEFDEAADQLYGLPAEEFTAARDAKAKAVADPATAAAIKKLRRPSRSAWLANTLVRKEKAGVDELLKLGESMRAAQARLDGDELRRLSGERRSAVAKLVQRARELSDQEISESIARELEGILSAAIASEEAAEELAAGRLSAAVAADGGAPLMWTGGGAQVIPLRPRQKKQPEPKAKPPEKKRHMKAVPSPGSDERRAAEARRVAEKERKTAQQAFDQADAAAEKARQAADNATAARKEAGRRIVELTEQLEEAQQQRTAADREVRITGRERDNAQRLADRARRRLDRAQAALDQLDE